MNVEEIKVQAQLEMCMQMQLPYVTRFLNEGLNELALTYTSACKKETVSLEIIKDTWTDLPDNFIEPKGIKPYTDYSVENNQIKCDDTGTFEISYLRLPTSVNTKTDIPDIHSIYHYALALFVASREKSRLFGEEDMESVRLMNEFLRKSAMAHSRIRKKGGRIRV